VSPAAARAVLVPLALVHELVGPHQELLDRGWMLRVEARHARADREVEGPVRGGVEFIEDFLQTRQRRLHATERGVDGEYGELVAAHPSLNVRLAERPVQEIRGQTQGLVAHVVAERIVISDRSSRRSLSATSTAATQSADLPASAVRTVGRSGS
jgi:hypothetical protein